MTNLLLKQANERISKAEGMIEEAFLEVFRNLKALKLLHSNKQRLVHILRDMEHEILNPKRSNLELGMLWFLYPWV